MYRVLRPHLLYRYSPALYGIVANPQNPEPSDVLGVFGLSQNTTEGDLDAIFSKHGRIRSVTMIKDKWVCCRVKIRL